MFYPSRVRSLFLASWASWFALGILASPVDAQAPAPPVSAAPEPVSAPPALGAAAQHAAPPAGAAVETPPYDPWILHTADNKYTLRIGAQIQFRYQASDADRKADRQLFQMRQVRPQIRGTIGKPWISFFIQPELAGTGARLLDLEITAQPVPEIGLKLGQFLTPFSRTFYTPVPKLLFPDFSLANDAFRADRDTGVMLFGQPFSGLLEYYVGAFNGNRIDQGGNDDSQFTFIGRLAVNPLGAVPYDETPALAGVRPFRIALGANTYRGEDTPTPAPTATGAPGAALPMNHNTTMGADLFVTYWLATLQAEAYYRLAEPGAGPDLQQRGGYVHASSFVYFPYVELAGRVDYLDPNTDRSKDQTLGYEGLLNLYAFGNHLKLGARYAHFALPRGNSGASNALTVQVQAFL